MLQILEVDILSIDKGEENWEIEGEIVFEGDLTSAFDASYLPDEEDLDALSLETELEEGFDLPTLKELAIAAVRQFED